jgi:hypothetical protein
MSKTSHCVMTKIIKLKLKVVIKFQKMENIGWDATSKDKKYLGRKIR